jgi:hypothetical protein
VINQLLGKDGYKRSYLAPDTEKSYLCINIVEDIIGAFSNNNVKTCDSCRQLVADIISAYLVNTARRGGLLTTQLTEKDTQFAKHKEII